ncbi:putative mitochondrial hypothetical protein [Leptomonas pyrrhocoris]|uniref:DAGKc domain-containing protein n=1 Tax=Leptomonas pyrrhocoris TaxID=157538 RepID=A0A0N1J538_LEPPY|nr:putative mitochondrial hypothetical protein [Leptomonas pyrrhocoris]XP_015661458.1 putative mitochondrial hypothetical protein [Leptomonas pyrrhocoris]KPA83018.1 putative mitochondrial hypothetical protein [Leptomonas pyrrhocoris]KPA83019.1 putative mitochondrial hypothetical protein [Leptomonas pyrrhocoris]|eukprot:XP_015661457.1 putative mitochondrial hypothetical protein [Leptomonas pyrrhocoris]
MTILKRCAAVINHRSGHRHSVQVYTDTLKQYMDRAGIVHHDIHIPNDDVAESLRRALPHAEALMICGGDGTVNSVVNLMAALKTTPTRASSSSSSFPSPLSQSALDETPLLLVPTGLHNSVATSLGVGAAMRAVSSLVVGRTVRVPLWAVHLHPPSSSTGAASSSFSSSSSPVRYMCSYVAAGTYAAMVQRQEKWKEAQEDYVSFPALLGSVVATSLYTVAEHASPHCTAALTTSSAESRSEPPSFSLGPLRLLVAAQMPQLGVGYSLTPTATYHQHRLTVTAATDDVTRLRMCHLLRREAREGYILSEDGVTTHEGVRGLRIEFPHVSEEGVGWTSSADIRRVGSKRGNLDKESEASALLVLDGECVRVPHGSSLTVTPTELTVQFIVS